MAKDIAGIIFPGSTEQYNFQDSRVDDLKTTVAKSVTLTQAEYDQLKEDEKIDEKTLYVISDASDSPIFATLDDTAISPSTVWSSSKTDTTKMDKENPTGTGSFSLNRKADTTIGKYSVSVGKDTEALGNNSHAEGNTTRASGQCSHAEGQQSAAYGDAGHAEGWATVSYEIGSHSEGFFTRAESAYQHVQGKFNIADSAGTYADIVGNGTYTDRANISALDWNGNLRLKGDVYTGCNSDSSGGNKLISTADVVDTVEDGNSNPVTSNAVNDTLANYIYNAINNEGDSIGLVAGSYYKVLNIKDGSAEYAQFAICHFGPDVGSAYIRAYVSSAFTSWYKLTSTIVS